MTIVLRAAVPQDLPAIYEMAKSTGSSFTNLPPDREKLAEKLAVSSAAFARREDTLDDDKFMFLLEDRSTGHAHGTCQIFSMIGATWPCYSYRIDAFTQYSDALRRTIRSELLTLCTDHSGCSEVAGLFLNAGGRAVGNGALLARSRYLFIRTHRKRFAERTIAELRGVADEGGDSPFWDGVGGRFFGMTFREADEFNAVHGNQFIADLMPKISIYKAMLPESALHVVGVPHVSGRPAMRMLQQEGFTRDRYIDIFDGGPAMTVATDEIATIRNARDDVVVDVGDPGPGGTTSIVAIGKLATFRSCLARVSVVEGGLMIDPVAAEALGIARGAHVTHVPR